MNSLLSSCRHIYDVSSHRIKLHLVLRGQTELAKAIEFGCVSG